MISTLISKHKVLILSSLSFHCSSTKLIKLKLKVSWNLLLLLYVNINLWYFKFIFSVIIVEAKKEKEDEAKKEKFDGPIQDKVTLDEQLKLVKVPVIGKLLSKIIQISYVLAGI